jgi:hypothetical protein
MLAGGISGGSSSNAQDDKNRSNEEGYYICPDPQHAVEVKGSIRPIDATNMPNTLAIGMACIHAGCILARGTWGIWEDEGGEYVSFPGLRIGKVKAYFQRRPRPSK